MKKYSHIINIAMVVIGIIGLLFYFYVGRKPVVITQQVAPTQIESVPKENITVAVANRELTKGTRLTASDFKLKTLEITKGSNERSMFAIAKTVDNWIIKSDVTADSYIPVSALVAPGTEEYIVMSAKPGSIVYGFSIKDSDSYLFSNTAAGEGVDIYLSYQLREVQNENGSVSVTPVTDTSNAINSKHFKLIMKDKKVLAINRVNGRVMGGNGSVDGASENPLKKEGYILVELTPDEVKTLKGLDGAKLYIFPTLQNSDDMDIKHSALVGAEGQWPIDNRDILSIKSNINNSEIQEEKIKEYRGEK